MGGSRQVRARRRRKGRFQIITAVCMSCGLFAFFLLNLEQDALDRHLMLPGKSGTLSALGDEATENLSPVQVMETLSPIRTVYPDQVGAELSDTALQRESDSREAPQETGEPAGATAALGEQPGSLFPEPHDADAFGDSQEEIPDSSLSVQLEDVQPEDGLPEDSLPEDEDPLAWRMQAYPVPRSWPVNQRYFHDALFIGDSRVMGLMLYSGINGSTFYTEKGINVNTLLDKPIVMQTGGDRISVLDALDDLTFAKIYIKIGLNELGWNHIEDFTAAYGKVIDQIREKQPGVMIYVMSILPVSQGKDKDNTVFTNQRIMAFNELILKMAWEKNVYYLDVYSHMINEEGFLPDGASSDGIHLNRAFCELWLDYLFRHTVRYYDESFFG